MPVSADIFGRIEKPRGNNLLRDYANVIGIQQGQQQNELGRLNLQKAEQGIADDAAVRSLAVQSAGDENALLKALRGGGYMDRAAGLEKQIGERTKAAADVDKTRGDTQAKALEMAKTRINLAGQAFGQVRQNPTPEAAIQAIDYLGQNGIYTPEQVAQYKAKVQAEPGRVGEMADQAFRAAMDAKDQLEKQSTQNLGGTSQTVGVDPVTGKSRVLRSDAITQSADNIANNQRMAAEGAANRGVQMRGQNLTDSRARESNGKAPAGYVWGPPGADGNPTLIAAKGGPADLKLAGALNADTQALTGSTSSMDRLSTAANEVLNHPGLASVYGLRGAIPNIPGSEAADAAALLNTLKSQVGFGVLQDMRNNSKTGGALGAVSDKENAMLQANLAALEKAQSVEQAKKSLGKIIEYTQGAKDRLRSAYNLKHGQGAPAAQAAPTNAGPQPGSVEGGYRFKGGNPSDAKNWEKQ